jgi:hypothetical protein
MDDAVPRLAPRHPDLETRGLIAWPGYRSGLSVEQLDRRVIGAIAKPLFHAAQDPKLVKAALARGMGVVLPGQAWRNQLALDHPGRTGAFARFGHHRPGLRLAPDERRFGGSFAEAYAADHLGAELGAGATIATTPGHVLERECSLGRENDLLLARLAAQEFITRRAFAPAPGRPATAHRELYATIILQGHHAKCPEIVDELVTAYANLEHISGYWIVAANYNHSGVQLAGYTRLALGLEQLAARPAVVSGVGAEHLALLASGVAATCAGLHGMSFAFPPAIFPESEEGEDEEGLGIYVYHRAVLGFVGRLGAEGEPSRRAIFANRPCLCGHHPSDQPPKGRRATVAHNSWAVSADALEFATPNVLSAEERLSARSQEARRQRKFLQLSALRPGFASVPRAARELREQRASEAGGSQEN